MDIAKKIELCKSIYWFLLSYYKFKKKLMYKYNLIDIKIFKFSEWHHGAYYFTAKLNNKKVFIKTDFIFNLLENELRAFEIFREDKYLNDKVVNVHIYSTEDNFIVQDYLDSFDLLDYLNTLDNDKKITKINEMIKIVLTIQKLNIIHRDIKINNFLVIGNNVKIIDFLFCMGLNGKYNFLELSENVNNQRSILKGMNYGNKPAELIWDDTYALINILNDFQNIYNISLNKEILKLKNLVGKYTYEYK